MISAPATAQPPASDRFMRRREVEELVGYGKSTLYRMIKERGFPAPIVCGASSRWSLLEVTAWMETAKQAGR